MLCSHAGRSRVFTLPGTGLFFSTDEEDAMMIMATPGHAARKIEFASAAAGLTTPPEVGHRTGKCRFRTITTHGGAAS